MGRVAVVVVLEGPDAVTERQTSRGAVVAVWQALRAGADQTHDIGMWLLVEYAHGEKVRFQVYGVDDVNTMIREGALSVNVTGFLFGGHQ